MEAALQRRIQRYGWDKASNHYEMYWQEQLKPAQDVLLQMAELKNGEHVVDIACGTGLVTFRAAKEVGENGSVVGTDISDKMIDVAASITTQKKYNNIKFLRMDAEELQLSDSSFDVALCALGLMYFPNPIQALREMYRILKPGGRAIAAVWGKRQNCGWAEIFPIVDRRVASEVCPMFFSLGNEEMLLRSFNEAGFSNTNSQRIKTQLQYNSVDDACGAAFAGGPVALAYSKFSKQTKAEVHAEYLGSIEAYRSDKIYNVPGEFVITTGYKK
jgi:ubiquinone/menaquinone biosynthesis C-methylase UbiE